MKFLNPILIPSNSARKDPNTSANPQPLDLFPVLPGTLPLPHYPPSSPKMHTFTADCRIYNAQRMQLNCRKLRHRRVRWHRLNSLSRGEQSGCSVIISATVLFPNNHPRPSQNLLLGGGVIPLLDKIASFGK